MRRVMMTVLFVFVLCCASASKAAETQNLLENGDFETDQNKDGTPDGWRFAPCGWTGSKGTIDWVKDVKHSGKYAVKLQQTNDKGRLGLAYVKNIPVQPGDTFIFSGWAKTEFPEANKTGRAYMLINEFKGKKIGRERTTTILTKSVDWKKYELAIKVGPGVDSLRVTVTINGGVGTHWVDDLALIRE